MRLGIMQPYFFPYAQQFRHINQCDHWIVFDTPMFARKTWVSRNRIGNLSNEWSYISVPAAKGATQLPIHSVRVKETGWRVKLFENLRVYSHSAPFYKETINLIKNSLDEISENCTFSDLNTDLLNSVCNHLGITTEIQQLSKMNLDIPSKAAPGEWACYISKAFGAHVYSNAPGGRDLFDKDYYKKNDLILEFYEPIPLVYSNGKFSFVPGLSVVDSLMWMGRESLGAWCKLG